MADATAPTYPEIPVYDDGRPTGAWSMERLDYDEAKYNEIEALKSVGKAVVSVVDAVSGDPADNGKRYMDVVTWVPMSVEDYNKADALAKASARQSLQMSSVPALVSTLTDSDDPSEMAGVMRSFANAVVAFASQATTLTDEMAVNVSGILPAWVAGEAVVVGQLRTYGGKTYRCVQAHTTQAGWEPGAAASLWSEVSFTPSGIEEWRQPTGAHDAYAKGKQVSYQGKTYESLIEGNTTVPGSDERWWKLVE